MKPWIKELGTSDARYDKAAAERYLRKLCAIAARATPDYQNTPDYDGAAPNRMGIPGDL